MKLRRRRQFRKVLCKVGPAGAHEVEAAGQGQGCSAEESECGELGVDHGDNVRAAQGRREMKGKGEEMKAKARGEAGSRSAGLGKWCARATLLIKAMVYVACAIQRETFPIWKDISPGRSRAGEPTAKVAVRGCSSGLPHAVPMALMRSSRSDDCSEC
jgi:hypothetical protein